MLAQSLRENGGHADVVVMLPAVHAADRAVRTVLYSYSTKCVYSLYYSPGLTRLPPGTPGYYRSL